MFDQMLESYRKATESTLQMQQELMKSWTMQCPWQAMSAPAVWGEKVNQAQKKWAELAKEMFEKHQVHLESQMTAGLKSIEDSFEITEAKDPQELQQKLVDFYRKSFETLRELSQSQLKEAQELIKKWSETVASPIT